YAGALEKRADGIFRHVAKKFNVVQVAALLRERTQISRRFRVVHAANQQLHVGDLLGSNVEGLNHGLKPLVSSPFTKSQNSMSRITSLREGRVLWLSREDAVFADINDSAPILFP